MLTGASVEARGSSPTVKEGSGRCPSIIESRSILLTMQESRMLMLHCLNTRAFEGRESADIIPKLNLGSCSLSGRQGIITLKALANFSPGFALKPWENGSQF